MNEALKGRKGEKGLLDQDRYSMVVGDGSYITVGLFVDVETEKHSPLTEPGR